MRSERSSAAWRISRPAALIAILLAAALAVIVPSRVRIESDVISGLPAADPVIDDTRYALRQHGLLDTVFLDLSLPGGRVDPAALAAAAERVAGSLRASGLFLSVGGQEYGASLAGLVTALAGRLPLLFDERELKGPIAESLRPEKIREALQSNAAVLRSLEGIGQAEITARDPFGWRGLVLSRLGILLPRSDARMVSGQIVSADERHLLLPVQPARPGTDTVQAAKIRDAIDAASASLAAEPAASGGDAQVLSVGAFRSTLDNERYSRRDAARAALISLLGIALLLILTFPRPWLGLLSMVPAVAGTGMALLTVSLSGRPLSILALGFGGALIGIAVDQGLSYFVFLDGVEKPTTGWQASASVWVVSLAATLTTIGAFLALLLADFPILRQLGVFAALGSFFAFLFVHLVFPLIFKAVPPAPRRKKRVERLTRLTTLLAIDGGRPAAIALLGLSLVLAFFAKPRFEGDLRAINSVSPDTIRSERVVQEVWGDVMGNVYVLLESETPEGLRIRSDRLAEFLRQEEAAGRLAASFTPSMVLPGAEASASHLAAWQAFWTAGRIADLRAAMQSAQSGLGFSARAFEPFFRAIESPSAEVPAIPAELNGLLGIVRSRDGTKWMTLNPVAAGKGFDREDFARRVKGLPGVRVLDYQLFADRLSALLIAGFGRMLLICVGGLAVVLFLFFLEATIPLIVLGHTFFALVCTLGTLRLLGRPIDIPSLALAVIIPGLGSDYALFFARSYQRYLDEKQASVAVFRNAVFLSAASSLIGFAGLAVGRHVLLRSIGWTGLLAVGYSVLGAFVLMPPILRAVFRPRPWPDRAASGPGELRARVRRRYRHQEAYARLFARFKLSRDPMFKLLGEFAPERGLVLDVGCGYGVPGAWLLARSPDLRLAGLEPNEKRAAAARQVFGDRGDVTTGAAPDIPGVAVPAEGALLLDVVHLLPDVALTATLRALAERLRPGGRLILREIVPGERGLSWPVRFEFWKWKAARRTVHLRTLEELQEALSAAGFKVERSDACALGPRVVWLVASR
jgi:uncharacterized protein